MITKKTKTYIKDYFNFLWVMTEKEIKARYKRAVFGFLWVFINPIFQMLVMGVILSFFINIPDYFLFLFTGLLPWSFFSQSLGKATPCFIQERSLLQKAKFPKESIPVSILLSNFIHLVFSLAILIVFLIIAHRLLFPEILLVIPALFWLFTFTLGLSLLTATLQVSFRDINFFVQSLLLLWFYATPILYSLSLVPKRLELIFLLNPLTSIFELFRYAVLGQGTISYPLVICNLVVSLSILVTGIYLYRHRHMYFVDLL